MENSQQYEEKDQEFVFKYQMTIHYKEVEEELGRPLTEKEKQTLGSKEFAELLAWSLPYKQIARYLATMLDGTVKDPFANVKYSRPSC